jgi:WD40 repeat protein
MRIGDSGLALLDVGRSATFAQFSPHDTNYILALALSPDGKLLTTLSERELKLWDISAPTNPPSRPLWSVSVQEVSPTVTFTPDGQSVVALGKRWRDGSLGVWDAHTGRELARFPKNHIGYVFAVVFSPDGQLLAVSGWDGRIVLWDFAQRKVKGVLTGHVGGVKTLAITADGHRLISGGLDNAIRIWDLDREKLIGIRRGHRGQSIESIAVSPAGTTFLSTGGTEIKLWSMEQAGSRNILDAQTAFGGVALSSDGKWAITSSIEKDRSPGVWDVASRSKKFELGSVPDHTTDSTFSPDGRWFALGSEERKVRLWNTQGWGITSPPTQPDYVLTNEFEANRLAFSPDNKILAVAGITFQLSENPSQSTNRLAFWDLASRTRLHLFHGAGVGDSEFTAAASVEFSHDGRLMAIGFRDGAVRLWDVGRQRLLKEFRAHTKDLQYGVGSISFSPDGHWLASSAGATMVLYDLERLEPLPAIAAHTSGVGTIAFAPDNKTLISAGREGRIKCWNLATREVALTLKHSDGPNTHIALTADGTLLASMDAHGILKFWPVASVDEVSGAK